METIIYWLLAIIIGILITTGAISFILLIFAFIKYRPPDGPAP